MDTCYSVNASMHHCRGSSFASTMNRGAPVPPSTLLDMTCHEECLQWHSLWTGPYPINRANIGIVS